MDGVPGERAKKIRGCACFFLRLHKGAAWRGDYQDRIRWSAKVFC
jgi:hypothetical protein